MNAVLGIGGARMFSAINEGDDLAELLNGLFANRAGNSGLIVDALSVLVSSFCAARDAGANVSVGSDSVDGFLRGSAVSICFELSKSLGMDDGSRLSRQLTELVASINAMRQAGYRFQMPVEAESAQPVRIIGMPSRTTVTEFERDPATMEIVRSKQVESYSAN